MEYIIQPEFHPQTTRQVCRHLHFHPMTLALRATMRTYCAAVGGNLMVHQRSTVPAVSFVQLPTGVKFLPSWLTDTSTDIGYQIQEPRSSRKSTATRRISQTPRSIVASRSVPENPSQSEPNHGIGPVTRPPIGTRHRWHILRRRIGKLYFRGGCTIKSVNLTGNTADTTSSIKHSSLNAC